MREAESPSRTTRAIEINSESNSFIVQNLTAIKAAPLFPNVLRQAASGYADAGLSVVPALVKQKRPTGPWKVYQNCIASKEEIYAWHGFDALALVTGAISGNLELLDFDHGAAAWPDFCEFVEEERPGLLARLVVERSQSGGKHLVYRCPEARIPKSEKLAQCPGEDGRLEVLIETRGEGGLFLCAPSPGYELESGDLAVPPVISREERETLLRAAKSLNRYFKPVEVRNGPRQRTGEGMEGQKRAGDDFNERGNISPLLEKHGWTCTGKGRDDFVHYRRPGKQRGNSATLIGGSVFYVFSSNAAPFDPEAAYSPFAVYALLEHDGDFSAAALALGKAGYGDPLPDLATPALPATAEPVRFWDRESRGDPFPVDALPETIRDAVLEYQAFGQQPAALIVSSALAAVNLVTQGLADVARDRLLEGPSGLFFMPLADSGERKSAADAYFSRRIREWDRQRREQEKEARKQAAGEHEAWKAEKYGILDAIKKAAQKGEQEKSEGLKKQAAESAEREPVVPPVSETFFEDTNPAALADRLANQGSKRAALWSSEALAVTGGSGMSSENFRATFGLLNKLWADEGVSYVRKVATSAMVEGVRFSANLMMQQAVFQDLLSDRGGLARGSGLLARFLLSAPPSTMGTRLFKEAPASTPAGDLFHGRLFELLELPMNFDEMGRLAPPVLALDPEAKALWIEYHNEVETRLAPLAALADVADFGAKSAENAARLACTFHVFELGQGGSISARTMAQACEVAAWFLSEAQRIFGLIDVPQEELDAVKMLRFLARQMEEGKNTFRVPDLLRTGPGKLRTKKRRDPALAVLRNHGWITRKGEDVTVHPTVKGLAHELP